MSIWQGSDLKFLVEITAEGFDIDNDNYTIVLKRGAKEVTINKSDIIVDDDEHFLCVTKEQLAELGTGDIYIVTYAEVPDPDFVETNIRREVDKQLLCTINRV